MSAQNEPTPPSSTSSNGASPDTQQQFRVVRKRNRVPLSCAPCRHRKLKCNRAHPCDNCTKRGDTSSCSYATPGNRKKSAAAAANASPEDMQNRIDRLEGLVLQLMDPASQQSAPTATASTTVTAAGNTAAAGTAVPETGRSDSISAGSDLRLELQPTTSADLPDDAEYGDDNEIDQVSRGIGIMKMDNGKAVFASESHWYAILGELGEVKKYFEAHKEDYKAQVQAVQAAKADESPGTAFLHARSGVKDKSEVLAAFPPKIDADRLIARYFNAYDPSVHIIHGPSFQKQYDKHWLNPNDSSVVWLGMCFSMMTLALQSYLRAGDEPPDYGGDANVMADNFRRLTAQCLRLADITQPYAQILETMILHLQAEYGRSKDAEPGVLLVMSLCVRLAMKMGYHRDPGPYAQITPFQGEMRRRVFAFVRQCDLLFSFQFGLPPMIRFDHMDTQIPRNLYDDELYEEMTSLPPSRPSFEATPMTYMISKSKMTLIFGKIVERVASVLNPPSYEETMKFDQELRDTRATHPPLLQMRSFQESARDPANLIMQRVGLEMVYLRSLFVLHRRFIARGRENPRYAYSREICLEASLQLLSHQATLHTESQSGGRLKSVKWYISSLTTHDFMLAAMLLCSDLYHTGEAECKRSGRSSVASPTFTTPSTTTSPCVADSSSEERRKHIISAVEHCMCVLDDVRTTSLEAWKAYRILRIMVDRIKAQSGDARENGEEMRTDGEQATRPVPSGNDVVTGFSFPYKPNYAVFPNGKVSDLTPDDLPPEQSAAMTLGMLSSGVSSPGPSFGFNIGQMNGGPSSSMAGLMDEPMGERTGLTPGYSGLADGSNAMSGAASPFGSLFGGVGGSAQHGGGGSGGGGGGGGGGPGGALQMGIEGYGGDIDWSAWDNYIANNTAMGDPSASLWPLNLDLGGMDTSTPGGGFGSAGGDGGGSATLHNSNSTSNTEP